MVIVAMATPTGPGTGISFSRHLRAASRRGYTAAMNNTRLSLLSIVAALALAGCGNKGPLVLPDAPEDAEAPATADGADAAVDDETGADAIPADDAGSTAEPVDDADTPVEPEPLPQDDGDSD